MSRADEEIITDIVVAARLIAEFIRGIDRDAFRADERTKFAVIHQLLIIGEASKQLSSGLRDANPNVPRSEMARMRDLWIHSYHKVILDRVMDAAFDRLPSVLTTLEALAPKESE